jgi:hypothetical protein
MKVNRLMFACGLMAFSAFLSSPLISCSEEEHTATEGPVVPPRPNMTIRFRLGPFYGYDSLRHYEYSNTGYTGGPIDMREPDSAGRYVTVVGYSVEVLAPGPDTIQLRIGTRYFHRTTGYVPPDSFYDTLYANSGYVLNGDGFKSLEPKMPFPFLDRAYVTNLDTTSGSTGLRSSLLVNNLATALQGAPAEYTESYYVYAGGGGSAGWGDTYRQGVGLISYGWGGGRNLGMRVELVSAKP